MNHPAELAVHQYLENAKNDGTDMSEGTIDKVCGDIRAALHRQFGRGSKRGDFTLRMSTLVVLLVSYGTLKINRKLHCLDLLRL